MGKISTSRRNEIDITEMDLLSPGELGGRELILKNKKK